MSRRERLRFRDADRDRSPASTSPPVPALFRRRCGASTIVRIVALGIAAATVPAIPSRTIAAPDTVKLTNGRTIVVDSHAREGDAWTLGFGDGSVTIPGDQVASIDAGGESRIVGASAALDRVVTLKNGRQVRAAEVREEGADWILSLGGGELVIPKVEVESVGDAEANPNGSAGDPSAASGPWITVTLGRPGTRERAGTSEAQSITGRRVSAEGADPVVLRLPAGGLLRLPADSITETRAAEAPANEPSGRETRTIETTHAVELKNGDTLYGNIEETGDDGPVRLVIPSLGRIDLDPDTVANVTRRSHRFTIEPTRVEVPRNEGSVDGNDDATADAADETDGNEERAAVPTNFDEAIALVSRIWATELPDADRLAEIDFLVRELGRQRSQNRVRAERKLADVGPVAIPRLTAASLHPLDLTRRAVQRLVRDYGVIAGAPLAIRGLDDSDRFVRELAHDALRRIFDERIRYDESFSAERRARVQQRYWQLWAEAVGDPSN